MSKRNEALNEALVESISKRNEALVESMSKRNEANITRLAKSLANFADSDHRWKDQATQKLDKITRQLEEENDL
jgi:hypothetical protein